MNVAIQIKALTQMIYQTAKAQCGAANADPLVSEIIMEGVLARFRDDAYALLSREIATSDAPPAAPSPSSAPPTPTNPQEVTP